MVIALGHAIQAGGAITVHARELEWIVRTARATNALTPRIVAIRSVERLAGGDERGGAAEAVATVVVERAVVHREQVALWIAQVGRTRAAGFQGQAGLIVPEVGACAVYDLVRTQIQARKR